jgi:cellulose biosynthesis protein BcsQ
VDQVIEVLRQYGFLFAIIGGIVAALGVAFTIYKASHDGRIRFFKDRIHSLEDDLKAARENGDPVILKAQNAQFLQKSGELQNLLGVATADQKTLQGQCDKLRDEVATRDATIQGERDASQKKIDGLTDDLVGQKEALAKKDRIEHRRENLVKHALKLEGRIWQRKALRNAPPFRPLHERHAAIVSVVNLKGGVGKTTVTAQLAMGLSSRGYRVLMVDLDLQGSLSALFVNETDLEQRAKDGLLFQHLLTKVAGQQRANLLDYCTPVPYGSAAILPATDSLGYAESSLTMQWQLGHGKRDVRFLLRRGLHQRRVTQQFDIVLLDCPPILNACCLNALAASDYVLIPTVLSKSAARRVPLFLNRLESLKSVINPSLQVLGALLNRTYGAQLTQWERDLWNETMTACHNVWKSPIYGFQTAIRQTNEVRDLENVFARPGPGSELHVTFTKIVDELEARLPNDCRRVPTSPVGPGAAPPHP